MFSLCNFSSIDLDLISQVSSGGGGWAESVTNVFQKEVRKTLALVKQSSTLLPKSRSEDGVELGNLPGFSCPGLRSVLHTLPTTDLGSGVGTTAWHKRQPWYFNFLNQEPAQMSQESPGYMEIMLKVAVAMFLNTEKSFSISKEMLHLRPASMRTWKIKTFVDYSENLGI